MLLCAAAVLVFSLNHKNAISYEALFNGVYYLQSFSTPKETLFFIDSTAPDAKTQVINQGKEKGLSYKETGVCKAGEVTYNILFFKKADLET